MKSTLIKSLCLVLLSLPTMASVNGPFFPLNTKFDGTFVSEKTIYFFNYLTQKECLKDGGHFTNDTCEFPAEDEVKVKKLKKTLFEIQVSTIGTNARSCLYVGQAIPTSSKTLVSRDEETGCMVYLKYKNDHQVEVESTYQCNYFCGARVSLDIKRAIRE